MAVQKDDRWMNEERIGEVVRLATTGMHPPQGLTPETIADPHIRHIMATLAPLESNPPGGITGGNADTSVVIGKGRSRKPLKISVPMILEPLPILNLNPTVYRALIRAGFNSGCGVVVDDHQVAIEDLEYKNGRNGRAIFRISARRVNIKQESVDMADAFEIDLSALASTAPLRHDMEEMNALRSVIYAIREMSDYRVPVFVRIDPKSISKDVAYAVRAGADAVVVDEGLEARIHSPSPLHNMFLPATIAATEARVAMKETGAWEKGVGLILGASPMSGMELMKYLAMGPSAIYTSVPIMVALGCSLCGRCYTNLCEASIATDKPELMGRVDMDDAVVKISNLIIAYNHELRDLMSLSNVGGVEDLNEGLLFTDDYSTSSVTGLTLGGYGRKLPYWEI